MTAHPERNRSLSKQIDFNQHNPLLGSLSEALEDYEDFPEPHLNSYQLHILGELLDSLFWRYNPHNGQYSSCLYWSSHRQIFWHRSQSQDTESFIQLIERKINFAPGDAPGDAGELANYTFRKKAPLSSSLRGPATEWYESNITNAITWENVRTNNITRFSDGRHKFRYRMEVEHCVRGDGEEIRNFLQRIKRTVDKEWPDDIEGIAAADHGAERAAQGRQRRPRYIDYSLKGLRSRYLQRKTQEYLMENPNATWNEFSTRIKQRDVSFQVSSNFLKDEEQTTAQIATLGQEMKNLRSEKQEHRVNAVEKNSRTVDANQKGRQNATRFCICCRTSGHTPSWCRKKVGEEELKRIENERTAERKVMFTQDYNKKRGPDHGSEQWNRGQDFQRRNQNYNNDVLTRNFPTSYQNSSPSPNFAYENNQPNNRRSYDQRPNQSFNRNDGNRSRNGSFNHWNGNWRNNGNFLVLHGIKEETSDTITTIANQEVINLTTSRSADLTTDPRMVLHLTNTSSHKQ